MVRGRTDIEEVRMEKISIEKSADFNRGVSWKANESNSEGRGTPVVSIPNIQNGQIKLENIKHFLTKEIKEENYLQANDILFVGSSGSVHNVARSAIVKRLPFDKITHASFTFRARPNSEIIYPLFLFYLLNADRSLITPFIKRAADGKYNFQLRNFVENTKIPCPPLTEQKRIAKTLSTIQGGIETQDKIIAKIQELKKSTMEKIFTKGLNGEKTKQTEIGEMPEGWEIVKISDKYDFTKKSKSVNYSEQKEIAFVPMDLIPKSKIYLQNCIMKSPNEISSGTYFEEGDLLVSKITPCFENGKQCIAKEIKNGFGIATTEVIPIKERKSVSDKLFLFYYLLKGNVRSNIAGKMEGTTGRQRIPSHLLKNFPIPFPPLTKQKQIAKILQSVDNKLEQQETKKTALQEFFKTALDTLMKGKCTKQARRQK